MAAFVLSLTLFSMPGTLLGHSWDWSMPKTHVEGSSCISQALIAELGPHACDEQGPAAITGCPSAKLITDSEILKFSQRPQQKPQNGF